MHYDIRYKLKKVFEDLYAGEQGLLLYTLYRRYDLDPSEAIDLIKEYEPRGIIKIKDDTTVVLTEKGRANIRDIISELTKDDRQDKEDFLSLSRFPPIDIYAPYIPESIPIVSSESKNNCNNTERDL